MNKIIASLFLALAAISCSQQENEPVAKTAADRVDPVIYAAAIENPARSEADRARDAGRQPADVLIAMIDHAAAPGSSGEEGTDRFILKFRKPT
jgi:predicted methyltransferase